MAAVLCDISHLIVPTNTWIICPVSKKVKKRPLKENEGQNEVRIVLSICSFDNLMITVCRTQEQNLLLLTLLTMLVEVC